MSRAKYVVIAVVLLFATVAVSAVAINGGSPDFEYTSGSGNVTGADFTMTEDTGTFVAGTVFAGGCGLADVTITYNIDGGSEQKVTTGQDGGYLISGTTLGSVVAIISVIKSGYTVVEPTPVNPAVGTENFTMSAGTGPCNLSGTVNRDVITGDPILIVTTVYYNTLDGIEHNTPTDAQGGYSISAEFGEVIIIKNITTVVTYRNGVSYYTVNEAMPSASMRMEGDITGVNFTINTGYSGSFTVSGTVTEGGNGFDGVTVTYTVNGGSEMTVMTDPDGKYKIPELMSGDGVSVISVTKAGYTVNETMPLDIKIDGTITVRNTSSGALSGASWDVRDYSGNVIISGQSGDEVYWNSDGNNVFKVTLHLKTPLGIDRSITKDAVMAGLREYYINWAFPPGSGSTEFYYVKISIDTSDFLRYKNDGINRMPGYSVNKDLVTKFVKTTSTSNDAFEDITSQLITQFRAYGIVGQNDTVNRIMSFVQEIMYKSDIDTAGRADYWAYPIETLFTGTGDCEDVSMLTMSLVKEYYEQTSGSDVSTALTIFWGIGHAMAAIDISDSPVLPDHGMTGWYPNGGTVFYYACETTGIGWRAGEIPGPLERVWPDLLIVV